jgi:hypothetical protein
MKSQRLVLLLILAVCFLSYTACAQESTNRESLTQEIVVVYLQPDLTDKQVKQIASEYSCISVKYTDSIIIIHPI